MGIAAAIVVLSIAGYWILRPLPEVSEPGTTPVAGPCTLQVTARLPAGMAAGSVARTIVMITHPVEASARSEGAWDGDQLRHQFIIEPVERVEIAIEGLDGRGERVLSGDASGPAPGGTVQMMDVALRAHAVVPHPGQVDTEATRPQQPPPQPPPQQPAFNLALNITPFAERGRIERVWIDGREVNLADGMEFRASSGLRRVRVQVGEDRLTDTVTVPASGKATLSLFIGSGRGRLAVAALFGSEAGYADIILDGVPTGFGTPYEIRDVLEGPHEVEVTQEGYRAQGGSRIVHVRAGDRMRVEFSMRER